MSSTELKEAVPTEAGAVGGDATCRNCGAPAPGRFCGSCGQETAVVLPRVGTFLREAAGRYVALDGRLWRTLFALFARPGFLTLEYFAGRRRRYIRPARLFLVLYLLLFALIGLMHSSGQLADEISFVNSDDVAKEIADELTASGGLSVTDGGATLRIPGVALPGVEDANKSAGSDDDLNVEVRMGDLVKALPEPLRNRYANFKKLSTEDKTERIYSGMLRYGPYAMVALLPALALLFGLAYVGRTASYPGRPRRYAEHLVYAAHVQAFAALMLMAQLFVPAGLLGSALTLWTVYYLLRAQQVVYRGRWWAGVLRAGFVAIVYSVLLALAVVGLLAMAVMLR